MAAPTNDAFTTFLALEPILGANGQLEKRMENDASGRILYVGFSSTPNASTSDAIWMIRKFSYDGNGFLSRDQLPDDGQGFLYNWDNRATYFT